MAKICIWNFKNCQNFENCENFKSVVETWKFFSEDNFYSRFRKWCQISQKLCNLTRQRHFGHFLHFREDLFDHSQTLPKYGGGHIHRESWKKPAIFMAIQLKLPFKISKIAKISISRKFDIFFRKTPFFLVKTSLF